MLDAYHVERQIRFNMKLVYVSGIHKEDKQKIKLLLKHFIPDLFFSPRQELSDDEMDHDDGTINIKLSDHKCLSEKICVKL